MTPTIERKMPIQATTVLSCNNCQSRKLCLPDALGVSDIARFEDVVVARHKVQRGEVLLRGGDNFNSVYAIRSGFFKSVIANEDGREQVTGFHMAGDHLGMDGLASGRQEFETVALEDGDVCVIPFTHLEALAREMPTVQRHIHKLLSREIVRESKVMLVLGSTRAEERIANFLLNLSLRLHARGQSKSELLLRMKREEIGSFLCLKLETVSRTLSKFVLDGILAVSQRQIQILNMDALHASANVSSASKLRT
jgi:CRP/FNR family transcriptional regulator